MAHATKARWWSLLIAPQGKLRYVALRFAEPAHDLRVYYYAGRASNEPLLPLSRRERIA
jgi:hypothetical protein